MKTPALVAILIATSARAIFGQPAPSPPAFEVASVKPTSPQQRIIGMFTWPGGRITVTLYTLRMLIQDAFEVQSVPNCSAARGGSAEILVRDIEARPPESSKSSKANPPYPKAPPNDEQRQMLQTLLVDRFQLKYHIENQGRLRLPIGQRQKDDLKLKDAKNKDEFPWAGSVSTWLVRRSAEDGISRHEHFDWRNWSISVSAGFAEPTCARPDQASAGIVRISRSGICFR